MSTPPITPTVAADVENPPQRRRPRFTTLKRLFAACLALGIGIGIAIAGAIITVNWWSERPIQPTAWASLDLPVGLVADLKTDWDSGARYQFRVSPATDEPKGPYRVVSPPPAGFKVDNPPATDDLKAAFQSVVTSGDASAREFTIHLYDKAGFEICNFAVTTGPLTDSSNHAQALVGNGRFDCSRDDYLQLSGWNVGYNFPKLIVDTRGISSKLPPGAKLVLPSSSVSKEKHISRWGPGFEATAGDDTLTGFDLSSGHMEMKSGRTYLIYREGERSTVLWWQSGAIVSGKQPELHYDCNELGDCAIENMESNQVVHGKPLR
jgi:hypothetical protein